MRCLQIPHGRILEIQKGFQLQLLNICFLGCGPVPAEFCLGKWKPALLPTTPGSWSGCSTPPTPALPTGQPGRQIPHLPAPLRPLGPSLLPLDRMTAKASALAPGPLLLIWSLLHPAPKHPEVQWAHAIPVLDALSAPTTHTQHPNLTGRVTWALPIWSHTGQLPSCSSHAC